MTGTSLANPLQVIYFILKSLVDSFLPLIFLGIFVSFLFIMFAFRTKWGAKLREMI